MPRRADSGGATAAPTVAPSATAEYDTGIQIRYYEANDKIEPKIKRHYDIRNAPDQVVASPWEEAVSCSTVLKILDSPPTWWGMQIGVDGAIQLFNTGYLFPVEVAPSGKVSTVLGLRDPMGQVVVAGRDNIIALLKEHKMTVNDKKDEGSVRGTNVHDAWARWMDHQEIPKLMDYPPQEQGYVHAMLRFLEDAKPRPIVSEVMVASYKHKIAGRYDARLGFDHEARVVAHHTPVKGAQYTVVPPGEHLIDVKTSKYVYFPHPKQLAGYEIMSVECGFEPSSARAVLQFEEDGQYRYVRADEWCHESDFLTTLAEYRSQQEMKRRKPPGGRH